MQKPGNRSTIVRAPELLSGISKPHLAEILAAAHVVKAGARQVIIREGEKAARLFILKSGRAKFYRVTRNGAELLLSMLTAGRAFGLGVLVSHPFHYIGTVETTQDSELLVWDQARIRRLAQKYPRLTENALSTVLRYLIEHLDRLAGVVSCTAKERLTSVLVHLAKETGAIYPSGVEIIATNEELAGLANLSVFTVSRLLSGWAQKDALKKSRGTLLLRSPCKLL